MSTGYFSISRRAFAASLGAFIGGTAFGIDVAPKSDFKGEVKGRKLKMASVGCGGMGGAATSSLISCGCELVAICDVDTGSFARWEKSHPGIPRFTDYREMLKVMGDKFEVVQIGTPDHTHAYIAVDCMLAGKHVYVQKPLARTVEECELILKTQLKTGLVAQMGNQGHPGVWRYKSMLDADFWGDVKEFHSWSDRPIWPQGMKEYAKPQQLPPTVSATAWDCWCGPCPDHGYSSAYHKFAWRGWWDYGCGAIGDMAVHNADPAFWTWGIGLPVKVKADTCGEGPVTVAYPKKSIIEMTFAPGEIIKHEVKLTWYDGGLKPDFDKVPGLKKWATDYAANREKQREAKAKKDGKPYVAPAELKPAVGTNGLIVVGEKGTTIADSHASRPSLVAGDRAAFDAAIAPGDKRCSYNHYREFVEAVLENNPAKCGSKMAYAVPLTEALLIGCVALRFPGEELHFDPKTMKFTNKPEANEFLKAPKRNDWDFSKMMAGR